MTSSLRGLALCTALLLLLGLGWVLGMGAPEVPASPQLLARRPESVQSIRWLREGRARMTARRDGAGWSAEPAGAPRALPAKARVIDDLLDVLAGARWHRRDAVARAGAIRERVVLTGARGEISIGLGEALGDQRWLVVSERALLVDSWVARVLEKAPDELLDLAALPEAARSPVVEIHKTGAAPWQAEALVLQGASRVSPSRARLDEALVRALRDQLGALTLVPGAEAATDAAAAAAPQWSVRVAGGPRGEATLVGLEGLAAGSCAAGTRVDSSRLGAGCLDEAALSPLAALIDRAASDLGVEARPLAAAPEDIEEWAVATSSGAPDSLRLTRRGAGWSAQRGDRELSVEPAAVEQVLAALTSPWAIAAPPPTTTRAPAALTLTARHRDGTTVSLALRGSGALLVAVRDGEALALTAALPHQLSPAALASALASLSLWQLEPTSITAVVLDGQPLRRGAVIGEWLDGRGQPIAAARAAALEELLAQLASLRAVARRAAPPSAPRHTLVLQLEADPARTSPVAAAPTQHTLTLALSRGECAGHADGEGAVFAPELCAQLAALVP